MPFHHIGGKLQTEPGGQGGVGFGGVNDLVIGDPLGAREHFGGAVHHPFDQLLVFPRMLLPPLEQGFQPITAAGLVEFPRRAQHQSLAAGEGGARRLALQAHAQALTRHEFAHGLFDQCLRFGRVGPAGGARRRNHLHHAGFRFLKVTLLA